jgi:hypothetical protein
MLLAAGYKMLCRWSCTYLQEAYVTFHGNAPINSKLIQEDKLTDGKTLLLSSHTNFNTITNTGTTVNVNIQYYSLQSRINLM